MITMDDRLSIGCKRMDLPSRLEKFSLCCYFAEA